MAAATKLARRAKIAFLSSIIALPFEKSARM
jgi:hypothetical protein